MDFSQILMQTVKENNNIYEIIGNLSNGWMFNIRKLFFSYHNGIVVVLQKEGSESLSFRHIETFTFCPLKLCLHLLNINNLLSFRISGF